MLRKVGLALAGVLAISSLARAGTMVTFPSGSETISGYLAVPEGPGKKPAILVIHEWWGLDDFAKGKADHFAKQGYVALAVDLYRGKVASDPDKAHQLMRGMPNDRALRDMKSGVAHLRSRPEVDATKIGAVGWCMGGGLALDLAVHEPTLAGAVIYYGHLMTDPATIAALKVPLLGNFGGKDEGIPVKDVEAFAVAAKNAGKSVDFKIYPDAGHGFASAKDPKVYRPADAKDADARADVFLKRVL
jgi:carboxymethylenebutenolidase